MTAMQTVRGGGEDVHRRTAAVFGSPHDAGSLPHVWPDAPSPPSFPLHTQAQEKLWSDLSGEMAEVALLVAEGVWDDLLEDTAALLAETAAAEAATEARAAAAAEGGGGSGQQEASSS